MPKKRIILIGILLVFCLAGQWMLRAGPAADKPAPRPGLSSLQTDSPSEQKETVPLDNHNLDDLHGQLIKQLIVMAAFIAVVGFIVWWFARRYSRGLLGGKGRLITVADTVPLGPRKMVHILHVGSRKLLVGSTADSIRLLADITDALSVSSTAEETER